MKRHDWLNWFYLAFFNRFFYSLLLTLISIYGGDGRIGRKEVSRAIKEWPHFKSIDKTAHHFYWLAELAILWPIRIKLSDKFLIFAL